MDYVISEEELKNIFNMGINGEDFSFDDFLKSKQPLQFIFENEFDTNNKEGDEYRINLDINLKQTSPHIRVWAEEIL